MIHVLLKQIVLPAVPVWQLARKHNPIPNKDGEIERMGSMWKQEVNALTWGMFTLRVHKKMLKEYKGYKIMSRSWVGSFQMCVLVAVSSPTFLGGLQMPWSRPRQILPVCWGWGLWERSQFKTKDVCSSPLPIF